jgi:putative endonuclease
LLLWETYDSPQEALEREREIKKWTRARKEALIAIHNPDKAFLNLKMSA